MHDSKRYPGEIDQVLALPAAEALEQLASIPESQWFERKSGRIKPTSLAEPLVAMANAEGGIVVVGVNDGLAEHLTQAQINAFRQVAHEFTEPTVRTQATEISADDGRRVLVLRVAPSEVAHATNRDECFVRIGDESRKLTFQQRQELTWDRGAASFEARPVEGHLDSEQVEAYRHALGSSTATDALKARNLLTSDGQVTVAGLLLFGGQPQGAFPNAHVRVLKYDQNERGTGRRLALVEGADVRCEGSLPQQIDAAQRTVEQLVPRRRALNDDGRFEGQSIIPRDAWLEGLVNAVVHRSYSIIGDHIRIEIFPNRIEMTSPGRFPGLADPTNPMSISRNARNPRIARVCADLGITQELGEGIRRIFREMRRMGLTDPLYQQTPDAVRLTLMASDAVPEEVRNELGARAMRLLDALRTAQRPLGTGELSDIAGVTRPTAVKYLAQLRDAGLITWNGKSPRDPRAVWAVV